MILSSFLAFTRACRRVTLKTNSCDQRLGYSIKTYDSIANDIDEKCWQTPNRTTIALINIVFCNTFCLPVGCIPGGEEIQRLPSPQCHVKLRSWGERLANWTLQYSRFDFEVVSWVAFKNHTAETFPGLKKREWEGTLGQRCLGTFNL